MAFDLAPHLPRERPQVAEVRWLLPPSSLDQVLESFELDEAIRLLGEKRTLPLVARYADACNIPPSPELRRKLDLLRR